MTRNLTLLLLLVTAFSGCVNGIADVPASEEVGYLSIEVACQHGDATKASDVNIEDFDIVISGPSELSCRCADLPAIVGLEPGTYTVTVTSPETEPAAFNQPIYGSEVSLDIEAGVTSSTKLLCTMTNMKVTIDPSESFLSQVKSYTVTVSNGYGELVWNHSDIEERLAGFFTVAPLTVSLEGVSIDDTELHYDGLISDVESSDHHIITFDSL